MKRCAFLVQLLLASMSATPAGAAVISVGGAGVIIPTPLDALFNDGTEEDSNLIWVWDEQQDVPIAMSIPLDIDGTPGIYSAVADLTGGGLTADTLVDSHYIHFDQLFGGTSVQTATVTFENPIIGVQVRDGRLNITDYLGVPPTAYPTGIANRGLDWWPMDPQEVIEISPDRLTITVTLVSSNLGDGVRVITSAAPADCDFECHVTGVVRSDIGPTGDGLAKARLTICNPCPTDERFAYSITTSSSVVTPFVSSGTVTVPAGDCVTIPLLFKVVSALVPGASRTFNVTVYQMDTGAITECTGRIRRSDSIFEPGKFIYKVPAGESTVVSFAISPGGTSSDPEDDGDDTDTYELSAAPDSGLGIADAVFVLNHGPGEIVTASTLVDVNDLNARAHTSRFREITVSWNMDADQELESGGVIVIEVIDPVCLPDLDGDSMVGGSDLAILLAGWGQCGN